MLLFNMVEQSSYRMVFCSYGIPKESNNGQNLDDLAITPEKKYGFCTESCDKEEISCSKIDSSEIGDSLETDIFLGEVSEPVQTKDFAGNITMPKNLKYISECADTGCVYSREKTDIRERFEKKIYQTVFNKKNIKILFYGSFLLYQELRILSMISPNVIEVHLTDYAYKDFLINPKNNFTPAFTEFIECVRSMNPNINVYVHTDPDKLVDSNLFKRRFDIICGIDIDYAKGIVDNRPMMKKIATNTLKIDGVMYLSQHNLDQVDLCTYEITEHGDIKLTVAEDFVKTPYYGKYKFQHFLFSIYYFLSFIGLLFSASVLEKSPLTSIVMGTYCWLGIFHEYLNGEDGQNYFKRIINKFSNILKDNEQ